MSKKETPLFSDLIGDLSYGSVDLEMGQKLHELVSRCEATQRQGSIVLKLTVKPSGPGRITVHDDVKVTMPKEERGSSIMFVTPEGRITRNDPRQMELEGTRVVDTETGEIKAVPDNIAPLRHIG